MEASNFVGYIKLYLNTGKKDKKYVTCLLTEVRLKDDTDIKNSFKQYNSNSPQRPHTTQLTNNGLPTTSAKNFTTWKDLSLSDLNFKLANFDYSFDTDGTDRFSHSDLCLATPHTQGLAGNPSKAAYIPPPLKRLLERNSCYAGPADRQNDSPPTVFRASSGPELSSTPPGYAGSPNGPTNWAALPRSCGATRGGHVFKKTTSEQKYKAYRASLFSKFDEGIQLDDESWYSVTPEAIAKHIADRMKFQCILDGFCGSGGNLIQFALNGSTVIAVDLDGDKIRHAQNNAKVYGVPLNRVHWHENSFQTVVRSLYEGKASVDCVFLDPPWGGMDYHRDGAFDLDRLTFNLGSIYNMSLKLTPNVIFKFPRNCNVCQIASLLKAGYTVEVEKNYLNGRLKFLILYFGQCINETYASQIAKEGR